jgi:homoserine kinase
MPTEEARAVLLPHVSRRDAVYNAGRVALLVNALTTGKAEDLNNNPEAMKIYLGERFRMEYRISKMMG